MATTKLAVYNQALIQLKQSSLVSITEEIEARYVLDTLYDAVTKEMLEKGHWTFAMRSVEITQDTAITPAFGYSKAFNKPDDWVRTYAISMNEFFNPLFYDWTEEAGLLFADSAPIYLRYVSNDANGYGMDLALWTGRFTKAVAFEMAYRGAPKIAGSSDSFAEKLEGDAARAVDEALQFEALREPGKQLPQGRWTQDRFNHRRLWNGRK